MSETKIDFKIGDLVECEYIAGSFANARIISVDKKKSMAIVKIGIVSRSSEKIREEEIEVSLKTLTPWNPKKKRKSTED
ncbi:hypothetical protein [Bacillus paranthracis]|uniref:hypothetical protein n=1 Tax=Bacillus paranthracis TaxID=2026186 RepID=UPI002FDBC8EC|nr:hypothetical protein [Bacillus paranthracis]